MDRVELTPSGRTLHPTTNGYVVGHAQAALIDPAARSDVLDSHLANRTLSHVLLTHYHGDHVGAVAHYATEHDATVWALQGHEAAFEAATGIAPDRTLREGTRIETDEGELEVIYTPGHAREHVCFALGDAVVSGDLAVAEGSIVVGAPEGDMRAYLASLRRLCARDPDTLQPGHGPAIEHPRAVCAHLIDHRLGRERKIRAAVNAGARDLDSILDAAYEKDVSHVRGLAEATVRAHLEKLAVEGDLRWDGEHAEPA
ncbi:MBL fold metallo-hydrolase [Natronomonas sp. EA1]|uniref:MBL fold metallo-hydrolase n=1 Tax=Natronomonas sp. EA1 TaxID=3421655 RepID=UPI003EB6BC19